MKGNTAGGLKSDRTGFTEMRVTALIIVHFLWFFNTESLCIWDSVLLLKNQSNRTIIKAVTRNLVKPVRSLLSPPAVTLLYILCYFQFHLCDLLGVKIKDVRKTKGRLMASQLQYGKIKDKEQYLCFLFVMFLSDNANYTQLTHWPWKSNWVCKLTDI